MRSSRSVLPGVLAVVGACSGGDSAAPSFDAAVVVDAGLDAEPDRPDSGAPDAAPDGPVPAGARVLGMSASAPSDLDYEQVMAHLEEAGVTAVTLTLPWDFLEPDTGEHDFALLEFGLGYYRDHGLDVLLLLPAVNTIRRTVPADLEARIAAGEIDLGDDEVIERFGALLDDVLALAGDELRWLVLANEYDIYLEGRDGSEIAALGALLDASVAHVERTRPEVLVGSAITFEGLALRRGGPEVVDLWARGEAGYVTAYRAGNFGADMEHPRELLELAQANAGEMPIVVQEIGYATGERLGGTEAGQAEFVTDVFAAWDEAAEPVPALFWSWMYDSPREDCRALAAYYGLEDDESFVDFLCTLGLRTPLDEPKPGWTRFVEEAGRRGF